MVKMADEEEKTHLLGSEVLGPESEFNEVPSAPAYPDAPPPYSVVSAGELATLCCGVCGAQMALNLSNNQNIVRCGVCQEATPIRSPPEGKRFIRCPCNCLLICNMSSQRVACPRPQCKQILDLMSSNLNIIVVPTPGARAVCGHCSQIFMVRESALKQRVRCNHCRKVSFIGHDIPIKRCVSSFLLAIFFAIISGVLIATTVDDAKHYNILYAVWAFALLLCVASMYLAVYWVRLKVSRAL